MAAVRWISAEPLLGHVDLVYLNRAPSETDKAMPGFADVADFYLDALHGGKHIKMKSGIGYSEASGPPKLDWVVIGGENGPRPMHPDWARALRNQCLEADVPFFFKQWGTWLGGEMEDFGEFQRFTAASTSDFILKNYDHDRVHFFDEGTFPAGTVAVRVGKKAAGDFLDGAQHHNWPAEAA